MKALVFSAILLVLIVSSFGCRHTQPVASASFGQPGPGKIVVFITGDIDRPGRYYVDDGTALEGIPHLAGGLHVCSTCGMSPSSVSVNPQGQPEEKQRYSLSRTNQLQSVRLRDGDVVSYATMHF